MRRFALLLGARPVLTDQIKFKSCFALQVNPWAHQCSRIYFGKIMPRPSWHHEGRVCRGCLASLTRVADGDHPVRGESLGSRAQTCQPIESAQRPIRHSLQVEASSQTGIRFDSLCLAVSASKVVHLSNSPLWQIAPFLTWHRFKSPSGRWKWPPGTMS